MGSSERSADTDRASVSAALRANPVKLDQEQQVSLLG